MIQGLVQAPLSRGVLKAWLCWPANCRAVSSWLEVFSLSLQELRDQDFIARLTELQRLNEATKDVGAVTQLRPIAFRFR